MNILTLKKQLFFIDKESATSELNNHYEVLWNSLEYRWQRFISFLSKEDKDIYLGNVDCYKFAENEYGDYDQVLDEELYQAVQAKKAKLEEGLTEEEKIFFSREVENMGWAASDPSLEDGWQQASKPYKIELDLTISKEEQVNIWLEQLEEVEVK